jgi:hypothetical protein
VDLKSKLPSLVIIFNRFGWILLQIKAAEQRRDSASHGRDERDMASF